MFEKEKTLDKTLNPNAIEITSNLINTAYPYKLDVAKKNSKIRAYVRLFGTHTTM